MTVEMPIFVLPLKRSGGTLFTTMLGTHSCVAMSYEIYETGLRSEDGGEAVTSSLIDILHHASHPDPIVWVRQIRPRALRSFVACARRGGIEPDELLAELKSYDAEGGSLKTVDDRLSFIERLMRRKMRKDDKRYWGGKAKVAPEQLHIRHPSAVFFAMIRDSRDVLASQLNTGNFDTDASRSATEWRNHVESIRALEKRSHARAQAIRYESLVEDPEPVLRSACELIGIPFEAGILTYHTSDLSLLRNPHGHLSHQQIARGLTPASIGRYHKDLTLEQIQTVEVITGDLLLEYGYSLHDRDNR